MSDFRISVSEDQEEQLSLSETNTVWLRGVSNVQARLKIRAVECPGHPKQHYWIFVLQVIIPDGATFTKEYYFEVLTQADRSAREMRQTQKWLFAAEDIEFIRPDQANSDPFFEGGPSRKRRMTAGQDTNTNRTKRVRPTPGPSSLQLIAAPADVEDDPTSRYARHEASTESNDDRPMSDVVDLNREATAALASTESNGHNSGSGDTQQNSSETDGTTPIELDRQQTSVDSGALGSHGLFVKSPNPRKRKTSTAVARRPNNTSGVRKMAIPKSRHRGHRPQETDDVMDWEAEPTMQSTWQSGAHTDSEANTEVDGSVGPTFANEGSGSNERDELHTVDDLLDAETSSSSYEAAPDITKAHGRIETLVRAVVEGTRNFQEDENRKHSWMMELKARPEVCADAEALNATFLKQVNAVSMNKWVSYFLYGCSELVLGTARGRKRAKGTDRTIDLEGSLTDIHANETAQEPLARNEVNADSRELEVESESCENSGNGKDKRYRCRRLARIIISLINCLINKLDGTDAADEAFNVIPALAGEYYMWHRIEPFLTNLSCRLRLFPK